MLHILKKSFEMGWLIICRRKFGRVVVDPKLGEIAMDFFG
jgi:hypothetical protein